MNGKILQQLLLGACLLLGLMSFSHAQDAAIIGTITFQVGEARLERNGQTTSAVKGLGLKVGDRLHTGADGHLHARMVDNGFISVRPSGRLHIQSYTYAPQDPAANRVGLMLESGVARTVSGKAGEANREHYRFNTPIAAIGLRGTDYVVQALPEITRVFVLKGAVTLSAFGPGCLAGSLASCTGPLVRELAASTPHAYMEVGAKGGLPVVVPPDNVKDAPNKLVPPRPEEVGALPDHQLTSALAADSLRPADSVPAAPLPPPPPPPPPPPQLQPEPRPEIVWGRWSTVALQNTPTLVSLLADDREITFSNTLFGLLRPSGTPKLPTGGVIAMNYANGEAYLQNTAPGAAQQLTPAALSNGKLQLDFNNRQFSTSLNATAAGNTYALNAQGRIQFQGMLYGDPARSNMNLAGVLSNNANEAGYLFDANVAPRQTLIGATRWKR
jgi:hypothetical protein